MKRSHMEWLRAAAALGFIGLLVGCSSSTSTKASSTTTNQLQVQLIASRHAATDLLDACLRGDTPHVLLHVESHLRAAHWTDACKALRDHHAKLVSANADVRGATATVHVRLQTHDSHPQDFDEMWHLAYNGANGWQLAAMPPVMVGTWDHHDWTAGTTAHHDDHQTNTGTTVHHDDHGDHQADTSTTVHHDDHQTNTSTTVHHDDHQTNTSTTVHHEESDH